MGIAKFYGQLVKDMKINYEDFKSGTFPTDTSGVMIDMNDLFYFAAEQVYLTNNKVKYTTKQIRYRDSKTDGQLHDLIIKKIVNRLEMYLEFFEPEDYFVAAVDGPAPLAKISQQRMRRFKVSETPAETVGKKFDTAMFSPGTDMMEKIHQAIKKWFNDTAAKDLFPPFACYSSFHEPGEGEHKMIQVVLRHLKQIYPGDKTPKGLHIICGQDSDLMMLGNLLPFKNVVWNREDRDKESKTGVPEGNLEMVDAFKKNIYSVYRRDNIEVDFVLTYFTFGNDFIPKNPAFTNANITLKDMSSAYIKNNSRLVDLKTGKIIRKNFLGFLSQFEKIEQDNLNMFAANYNPSRQYPYDILMNNYKMVEGNRKSVDMDGFKQDWYQRMFDVYNENACKSCQNKPYDNPDEFMKDMFENYLEMLQWNLDYYLGNKVSWNFQYRFYFAPFLSDVGALESDGEILRNVDDWQENASILRQLIMISHPSKIRSFIPSRFHSILNDESIKELSPNSPKFFKDGQFKKTRFSGGTEYLFTTILPLVSQEVYEDVISKRRGVIPPGMQVNHNIPDIYIRDDSDTVEDKDLSSMSIKGSKTKVITYEKFEWSDEIIV